MQQPVKLLIGVISLAGLIAALIPSGMPAPSKSDAITDGADAPVTGTTVNDENIESQTENIETVQNPVGEVSFKFGDPTIDGKPYGAIDEPQTKSNTPTDAMTNGAPGLIVQQNPPVQTETDVATPVAE